MERPSTTLCLHLPVAIPLGTRVLHGELALPAGAKELRVSVYGERESGAQQREARRLARREIAALSLESAATMTSGDLIRVVDWVRSRRLLQPMPISLALPAAQTLAGLKAAHHRPACVCGVLLLGSQPQAGAPARIRHLRLAYSA